MATAQEKLQPKKPAPVVPVKSDFGNLHRSRDEFEAKLRKDKEIAAKLEAEKARLEAQAEAESAALEKLAQEEQAKAREPHSPAAED